MPERDAGPVVGRVRGVWVVLEGGTLTSSVAGSLPAPSTAAGMLFGAEPVVGNGVAAGWVVVGTLLGPEGTGPAPGFPRVLRGCGVGVSSSGPPASQTTHCLRVGGVRWGGGGGGRSFVESCTLDAGVL